VKNPNTENTASLVRSHLIHVSDSNLITIAGGKWTTYRKMAEEVIDKSIEVFNLNPNKKCVTEDLLLLGSHDFHPNMYVRLIQNFGIETEVAKHLIHNYGDRAFQVAALCSTTEARWPIMGKRLVYPYLFIEAEIIYACRKEYACTAVDMIGRRTRLSFLNAQAALEALPRVVEIMAGELKWSEERKKKEFQQAIEYLHTMGLNVKYSRAKLNSDELVYYKNLFNAYDKDKDGLIDKADVQRVLLSGNESQISDQIFKAFDKVDEFDFDKFLEIMLQSEDVRGGDLISFQESGEWKTDVERSGGGV
jgi:glycerol-3-phosphate dehydrogenase